MKNQNSNIQTEGRGASMAPIDNGVAAVPDDGSEIDDRGTDQSEASQILAQIRDGAFESSNEKLALALGRPTEEIEEWISGAGTIDGDVLQKARLLGINRGLQVD